MRPTSTTLAVLAALAFAATGLAQDAGAPRPGQAGLAATLDGLVAHAALGDHISVSVVDLRTGRAVYGHTPDLAVNPASNMKLVTAATALVELGASFRMRTALLGHVDGESIDVLYLRGTGDPTLRLADLVDLSAGLAARGVRRVGDVVVDGSYFDDHFVPPAFEQQPNEVAPFRAPISAVSVDENAYELRVQPGATVGAPAIVRLEAAGYFEVDSQITTSAATAGPNVIAEQHAHGDQVQLRVRGSVPLGILGVGYRRRIEAPLPYAGHAMVEALRRAGIHVRGHVRVSATPSDAALLTSRTSPPLSTILLALGKDSDNFVAETVLKVVGAERQRPGRTEDGAARSLAMLESAGVPHGAATVINGSGLFSGNLVAASHLTRLLLNVYRNPAIRAEYLAQLATAGVDGTLEGRLSDVPRGSVRAKTGTLDDAIALSGYVVGPDGDSRYAFSVLTNGVSGKHAAARSLCDDVARTLVHDVWPVR